MALKVPYVGPGADNYPGVVVPGGLTIANQITAYATTPAGTTPPAALPVESLVGLANIKASIDRSTAYLYNSLLNVNSYALFDFNDPVCNPLRNNGVSTGVLDPGQMFYDLLTYIDGSDLNGQFSAYLWPSTATQATAAPINYAVSAIAPNPWGILFSDTNAGSVPQCVNLSPGANTFANAELYDPTLPFLWAVAFETPAVLSTGTDASLFTMGTALDATLQVAFVVKAGKLGLYMGGNNYLDSTVTVAASTRYGLIATYQIDPFNPLNFIMTFQVEALKNNSKTSSLHSQKIPFAVNQTPWATYQAPSGGFPASQTLQSSFGPQAAFGGQYAFLALGFYSEQLPPGPISTSNLSSRIDAICGNFNLNGGVSVA